jgi:hypothetical protein
MDTTRGCSWGVIGAVVLPVGLYFAWRVAANQGLFSMWSGMYLMPVLFIFGPGAGFAVGWLVAYGVGLWQEGGPAALRRRTRRNGDDDDL